MRVGDCLRVCAWALVGQLEDINEVGEREEVTSLVPSHTCRVQAPEHGDILLNHLLYLAPCMCV